MANKTMATREIGRVFITPGFRSISYEAFFNYV